tara:strand:- start:70 stop:384 length:315 start_codon:yes stop_codon:yes gene_type:complete
MVRYDGYDGRSEVSSWTNWGPKSKILPDTAGVYIYADINHQVKYIGKAGAGRLNLEAKSAMNNRNKAKGATLVKALITNSNAKAKSLEKYLVKKYQPPNNIRLK